MSLRLYVSNDWTTVREIRMKFDIDFLKKNPINHFCFFFSHREHFKTTLSTDLHFRELFSGVDLLVHVLIWSKLFQRDTEEEYKTHILCYAAFSN